MLEKWIQLKPDYYLEGCLYGLDVILVVVNRDDLHALLHEIPGHRHAENAEPEYGKLFHGFFSPPYLNDP